jgi:hypothetical protein
MNHSRSAAGASALGALEQHDAFIGRHIGTGPDDQAAMLATLGYPTREALIDAVVPPAIRRATSLALPPAMTEAAALARLRAIAAKNKVLRSFIGQGYTARTRRASSCATSSRTRRGTRRTHPISRRSRRGGWRRWSISRR